MNREAPIRVRVLFFAVLREAVGTGEQVVTLNPPAGGADLLDALEAEHPALAPFRRSVRLAVNQRYVQGDVVLEEGDEVALITPVSGG